MICLGCGSEHLSADSLTCPQCGIILTSFPVLKPGAFLKGGTKKEDAYQVSHAIGKGGFGITYKAWDRMNSRLVAIKELFPSEYATRAFGEKNVHILVKYSSLHKKIREIFIRESNYLNSLKLNCHIVEFFMYFEENNTSYIVMEYINGCPLGQILDEAPGKKLPVDFVVRIVSQIVDALCFAHSEGIYHCDLSPGNIMIRNEDARVKLIDFGAARYLYRINTHSMVNDLYSPIELLNRRDDIRSNSGSDIFMLGMLLHKMITGELPPTARQREQSHNKEFYAENFDRRFKTAVESALQFDIKDRPDDINIWWSEVKRYFAVNKCGNKRCKKYGIIQPDRKHIYCTQCGRPFFEA